MTETALTSLQEEGIRIAGKALKNVFPEHNLQICFNIAKKYNNVNFNIKMSGVLPTKNANLKERNVL